MKTITFQISDEAFELLTKIGSGGAEYRDTEYNTLEDFKNSNEYKIGLRTEEWFLNRNFGGTYHLIHELSRYGLVESDGMSWNLTYVLTDLGKQALKQ